MPDPSGGYETTWGELQIAPPFLKWEPDEKATRDAGAAERCCDCDWVDSAMQPIVWRLSSFAGVNEDPMESAMNQLRLLQGDDDGLLFGAGR